MPPARLILHFEYSARYYYKAENVYQSIELLFPYLHIKHAFAECENRDIYAAEVTAATVYAIYSVLINYVMNILL